MNPRLFVAAPLPDTTSLRADSVLSVQAASALLLLACRSSISFLLSLSP